MDAVNHPEHYTFSRIEVIDAIEEWRLGYHLGNVVKYVARADHKGRRLEDLRKARWYLDRYLTLLGGELDGDNPDREGGHDVAHSARAI